MTNRTYVKSTLLGALIALSVGGFLLHVRIHPFAQNSSNIVPVISCIISIIVVPLLFFLQEDDFLWLCFKRIFGYYRHCCHVPLCNCSLAFSRHAEGDHF
jgi:hypothetical protein